MKTERVNVNVNNHFYPIYIGGNLLQDKLLLQRHVKRRQVMIVSNQTVAAFYLSPLKAIYQNFKCDTFILPDGEQYKTLEYWERILHKLVSSNQHRDTTLIALGGGVIGDITGFSAACYQRGVILFKCRQLC